MNVCVCVSIDVLVCVCVHMFMDASLKQGDHDKPKSVCCKLGGGGYYTTARSPPQGDITHLQRFKAAMCVLHEWERNRGQVPHTLIIYAHLTIIYTICIVGEQERPNLLWQRTDTLHPMK